MPEEEKSQISSCSEEGKKVINELGLRPFSKKELKEMSEKFEKDLIDWSQGKKASLLMIPTYLNPIDSENLPAHKKALSVSIGGSTVRGALIEADNNRKLEIAKDQNGNHLSFQKDLPKREFESSDQFWNFIVEQILKSVLLEEPDSIALIWGFSADIKKTKYGIDGQVNKDDLEKGITIPGISNSSLGKQISAALKKRMKREKEFSIAIVNDTAAISLAAPDTKISVINGTGYNMAVSINGEFYNMEAGEFDQVIQNKLDKLVDEKSGKPGENLAEKQISGFYIGSQLQLAIKALVDHGLPIRTKENMTINASHLNTMLLGNKEKLMELLENPNVGQIDDGLIEVLKDISHVIADRSAAALGTYLAATVNAFPNEFPKNETVKVAFDGSVIRENPFYKEWAERYAKDLYGKNIQLVDAGQNADLLGAATAALTLNKT